MELKSKESGKAGTAFSSDSAIDHLAESIQRLWNAPGYKGLVRKFSEYLLRETTTVAVELVDAVQVEGSGLRFNRVTMQGEVKQGLTDVQLSVIAMELRQGDAVNPVYLEPGLATVLAGGVTFHYCCLGPFGDGHRLFFWFDPTPDANAYRLADFMARQLRRECEWHIRLDQTQSLLYSDDLTGLFNSRYLEVALDAELRRAERFHNIFCLLFIDLDGFKPINDQYGHLAGSSVLQQVARVLKEAVREIDIPIRYGGDEFVVLLLGATCAQGVLAAERVRSKIEKARFRVDGGEARLTASIGVAAFPDHARDRDSLLKIADDTMYRSKRGGKNRVTVVTPGVDLDVKQAEMRTDR